MGKVKLSCAAPIQTPFWAPIYTAVSPYIPGAVSILLQGTVSLLFLPASSMKIHFTEATTELLTTALSSVPKGFLALTLSGIWHNFRVQKAFTSLGTTAHSRDGPKGLVCSSFWNSDEEHIQSNTVKRTYKLSPGFVLARLTTWGLLHCNRD